MSTTASPTTAWFGGLVDDAAIFPPGNAVLPDALRAHRRHRRAAYADLVGPFVCSDTRLPELQQALSDEADEADEADEVDADPLALSLVVGGGAGAVEPALTWVGRDARLRLGAVEVALRDEDDLAHNAARLTTVLRGALPDEAVAYVEVPRLRGSEPPPSWQDALDELAAAGHRLKHRTGGPDQDAVPSAVELAMALTASLDRELAFKCTAGLHHAVRRTTPERRDEHGFLNVLLATRAVLDGAPHADVAHVLDDRDESGVADRVLALGADGVAATRRWFTSFGSCSIIEPVDDLARLGLLAGDSLERGDTG